ncbi:MAG: OmpH family outer membrane protein [Phycisphaerales bacterium]|nr:OmpH family outer membrane protein [Phycisphaerales bacterium]
MTSRERLLTWSTLTALSCLVVLAFLRTPGNVAMAQDESKAPVLGPASAVTLVSEAGDALDLRAVDGRLSWGDEPQQRTQAAAYVHIGRLLTPLMQVEERMEERQALRDRLTEDAQVMIDELETIQADMEGLTPEDEEGQELMQRGQQLAQQLQAFRQQATAIEEAKAAEQLEQCYRELVDAVNLVADRKKIDTVYRFIPTDDPFNLTDVSSAMLQIRLRSVLRYPEGADITEEIAEELNLDLE